LLAFLEEIVGAALLEIIESTLSKVSEAAHAVLKIGLK